MLFNNNSNKTTFSVICPFGAILNKWTKLFYQKKNKKKPISVGCH